MRRNALTVLVGVLLIIIFGLLLFSFQVRQTEIALVTTFDKPSRYIEEPGFKLKWPPPIQKVYKFDKRIQNFEQDKIEETLTKDNYNVLIQVYVGWVIRKPDLFFSSFPAGTVAAAEPALVGLIRSAKTAVVGKHPFSHFVSTDKNELQFVQIEQEILTAVQPMALKNYGVEIKFLGIKKLGLPESVTQKVFDRMQAERQREIDKLKAQGEAEAVTIKSAADLERSKVLAQADADATAIKGQAYAEAAKSFTSFEQNPELAINLQEFRALEEVMKQRTTLIMDERTRPFGLLTREFTNQVQRPGTNFTNQLRRPGANGYSVPADTKGTVSKNAP